MTVEEKQAFETLENQIKGFREELKNRASQDGLDKLSEQLKGLQDGIDAMKEKDVDKEIKTINEELLKFRQQVIELREEQAKERENGGGKRGAEKAVKREEIEAFLKATFSEETGEKTNKMARIAIKAPEDFGYDQSFVAGSQIDVFTGRYIDPRLYERKRKRNLILDHFRILSIDVPTLYYMEKVEVGAEEAEDAGGAAWIASGGEKPKRSFRVRTGKAEARKVAIFGTIDDKLLRDVPSFENWILEDFRDEIDEAYNDALLNNNPAIEPLAPLGVKQNAVLFEVTPAFDETIAGANYIDGAIAMIAAMADSRENPELLVVSTDVFYRMISEKDGNLRYQNNNLVYVNNLGQLFIAGVRVVDADKDDIPSTHALLLGSDLGFKIYNYGGMVLERGLNGTDFRHDRTSYRGYREVLSFIPSHRLDSVMYDTWANVLTAIEAPEEEPVG